MPSDAAYELIAKYLDEASHYVLKDREGDEVLMRKVEEAAEIPHSGADVCV